MWQSERSSSHSHFKCCFLSDYWTVEPSEARLPKRGFSLHRCRTAEQRRSTKCSSVSSRSGTRLRSGRARWDPPPSSCDSRRRSWRSRLARRLTLRPAAVVSCRGCQSRVSATWHHRSTTNTTRCHTTGPAMLITWNLAFRRSARFRCEGSQRWSSRRRGRGEISQAGAHA